MKRIFLICFILCICVFQGNAQSYKPSNVKDSTNNSLWGFYGVYNAPTNAFVGYKPGGGMGMEWYSPKLNGKSSSATNVRLGWSMFYSGQGSVSNPVLLHDPYKVPGNQTIHNNLFGMDFRVKIINEQKVFSPYVDLFCGLRSFASKQTLSSNTSIYGYQSSTKTLIDFDFASVLGTSFGTLIKMSPQTFLDLKVSYCATTRPVEYVNFNHMHYDGFMYDGGSNANTASMWSYQIGILFKPKPCSQRNSNYYRSGYYYHSSYHSCHSSYHGSCGHSGGRPLR